MMSRSKWKVRLASPTSMEGIQPSPEPQGSGPQGKCELCPADQISSTTSRPESVPAVVEKRRFLPSGRSQRTRDAAIASFSLYVCHPRLVNAHRCLLAENHHLARSRGGISPEPPP